MKAIVGTALNLPWWRLSDMSNDEIKQYNRKHLVEIEMNKQIIPLNEREEIIANMRYVEGWNAAIEECCNYLDSKADHSTITSMLRKLKK